MSVIRLLKTNIQIILLELCVFLPLLCLSGCGGGGGGISENAFNHFHIPEFCGDNIIQTSEQCDDGNNNDNDGCSATCNLEFSKIYAGAIHTCVLTTTGDIKCWGNNDSGQLGDGTTINSLVPVDVSGITEEVVEISMGTWHTCAVTISGGVKCWGNNTFGQLGNGSEESSSVPVDVTGLTSDVISISAGEAHTCAVTTNSGVKCWGYNSNGQLGNGKTTNSTTPVAVLGLSNAASTISAGYYYTCAVTDTNSLECWGLGYSYIPEYVLGLSNAVNAVSTGYSHTCVLTNAGGVQCWGSNSLGQLGNGSDANSSIPANVSGLTSGVSTMTASSMHTCVITVERDIKCWGYNEFGQLGDTTTQDKNTPVDIPGLSGEVKSISAGENHTCAITNNNKVKCWGGNDSGQLGDGSKTNSSAPGNVVVF